MNRWSKFLLLWIFICIGVSFIQPGSWIIGLMLFGCAASLFIFYYAWSAMEAYKQYHGLVKCLECSGPLVSLASLEVAGPDNRPELFWCSDCDKWFELGVTEVQLRKE